jgi:hypothetical protein
VRLAQSAAERDEHDAVIDRAAPRRTADRGADAADRGVRQPDIGGAPMQFDHRLNEMSLEATRTPNVERKARNSLGRLWARKYFVSRTPEIADKLQLKPAPHKVQSLVPESFITAFGGSHSNPQLCWGLLIRE